METSTEKITDHFKKFDSDSIRGFRDKLKTMLIGGLIKEEDEDNRDTLSWAYTIIDGMLELIEDSKVPELKNLAQSA